jgi:hypothetical protein
MTLTARIRSALPTPFAALAGAIAWALIMSASAGFALHLRDWYRPMQALELIAIFFAGGFLAWPLARFATCLAVPTPTGTRRIAANILGTSALTFAVTAFLFVLDFRWHYAHWHADFPSIHWFVIFFLTLLNVTYQFLVLGLALFLPAFLIAFPAYLAWAMFQARR